MFDAMLKSSPDWMGSGGERPWGFAIRAERGLSSLRPPGQAPGALQSGLRGASARFDLPVRPLGFTSSGLHVRRPGASRPGVLTPAPRPPPLASRPSQNPNRKLKTCVTFFVSLLSRFFLSRFCLAFFVSLFLSRFFVSLFVSLLSRY